MNNTDLDQIKTIIAEVRFQLENVEGWLSMGKTEAALIKAKCLVDAADTLKTLLNKHG